MVMFYTTRSTPFIAFRERSRSTLAKMEEIFYDKYLQATDPADKLKYITYFNHVAAMRNRLEFDIPSE